MRTLRIRRRARHEPQARRSAGIQSWDGRALRAQPRGGPL